MPSHDSDGDSPALVLGGETASLLDAPTAPPEGNPFSRAFETGGGRGGYTVIEEGAGGGPEGPPEFSLDGGFQSYHAQPPASSSSSMSSSSSSFSRALPPPRRHRGGGGGGGSGRAKPKTRFPSLTPAPGSFSAAGDTRAAEAVAQARKTWAPPALRTQAIASYGAVPDLEIIPENVEMNRFHKRQRIERYSDLGCPSCTIS